MVFRRVLSLALLGTLAHAAPSRGADVGTAFAYQGELLDGGSPASGTFVVDFRLFDDPTVGMQIDTTQTENVTPGANGRFTAKLDFGAAAFTGHARWLEIVVDGTTLSPRQELTPAPNAVRASEGVGPPNAIEVDVASNVGIGTSDPLAKLHIRGVQPTIRLEDEADPASYARLVDTAAGMVIDNFTTAGMSLMELNPQPLDGTGDAALRFFRITNTTGLKRVQFFRGDSTASGSAQIGVDGADSYFQIHGGNVGIGTNAPTEELTVAGTIESTSLIAGTIQIGAIADGPQGQCVDTSGGIVFPLRGFTGCGNTALGFDAADGLNPDDTGGTQGRYNTAVGFEALASAAPSTIGQGFGAQRNSALGRGALRDLQDGFYNDAFGADAGRHSNRTNRNTFIGNNAGKWVGSLDPQADAHPWWAGVGVTDIENEGCRNVMVGRNAGHEGVLAQSCVAVGYNAGANWGENNSTTAVGRNSIINNATASRSVGVGAFAMADSVSGGDDTVAIGYEALKNATGNNNVAIGAYAGRDNAGGQNVFIGDEAALSNANGIDNVMVGRHAGRNSDGSGNIFIGRMAGRDHSGRNNTLIIHNSGSLSPFLEGSMGEATDWWLKVRGDVLPNQDGARSLGRLSHKWFEVFAQNGIINTSDERLKKDIAEEDLGLEFIEALRPVVWRWKDRSDEVYHRGLIAQQVKELLKSSDSPRSFSGVVDQGGALGLREREFMGPLIKAVQQLSARVRELEAAWPEFGDTCTGLNVYRGAQARATKRSFEALNFEVWREVRKEQEMMISTIDSDGVGRAAIQSSHETAQEKECEIAEQQARIAEQDAQISDLQSRLARMETMMAQLNGAVPRGGK